jgi:tRNA (guanine-N7-)-methyltransferase
MGKDKLRKFRENETFRCLLQPATSEVLNCDHPIKGNWGRDFFGNDNPIVVELGCGKGDYTIDLAERNPDCNYIGVDIKGARLWKGAKYAEEHGLRNVAFLRTRIEFIESLFACGEVAEIWITFADPQIGREKKRLTSPLFLNRYRNFLAKDGLVHLKTDSPYLHEYSKAIAQQNGLSILACGTDIYGEDRQQLYESGLASVCGSAMIDALFEVQTFYESHFIAQGYKITYLSFKIDHEGAYISPEWEEEKYKGENHQAFALEFKKPN